MLKTKKTTKKTAVILFAFFEIIVLMLSLAACSQNEGLISDMSKKEPTVDTAEKEPIVDIAAEEPIVEMATVTYEGVKPFYDNIICVKSGGKYGIINNKGEVLVEPIYKDLYPIGYYKNIGLLRFYEYDGSTHKYKYGIVTSNGEKIFDPVYDQIYNMKIGNGIVLQKNNDDGVEFFVYLPEEEKTIELDWSNCDLYSEHMVTNNIFVKRNNAESYFIMVVATYEDNNYNSSTVLRFDQNGRLTANHKFDSGFYDFNIWNTNGKTYMVADDTVYNADDDEFIKVFENNGYISAFLSGDLVCVNSDVFPVRISGWTEYAFVNIDGEITATENGSGYMHSYSQFENGYYEIEDSERSDNDMGIVDQNGKLISESVYSSIIYNNGYFSVGIEDSNGTYYGCMDENGVLTCPIQYYEEYNGQNFFDAHKNGSNKIIVNPADNTYTEYVNATHLGGQYYLVSDGSKMGFANWEGQLTDFLYDKAENSIDDLISYDHKVLIGRIGKNYTIYSVK